MAVNSSNVSHVSSSAELFCLNSIVGIRIFTGFTVTNSLVVLPLLLAVLYVGSQQWRKQGPASTSPSDLITYHMTVMETIGIVAAIVACFGLYFKIWWTLAVSQVFLVSLCGQMNFHTLTCVERFLAVVHPFTYMRMRKGSRFIVRDIIIWCIWLLNCALFCIIVRENIYIFLIMYLLQQILSLATISFCSLAVLRVLRRSGVGSSLQEKADQLKQRAFNTMMAIMGTLLIRFGVNLICAMYYTTKPIDHINVNNHDDACMMVNTSYLFSLPSSLVLPLLFLHRAGKLPCHGNKSPPCESSIGHTRRGI